MLKKKRNVILISLITIFLCASLIAGFSFALFTDKSNVSIIVTGGGVNVEVTARDIKLFSAQSDDNGILIDEYGKRYSYVDVTEDRTFLNGGRSVFVNNKKINVSAITPGDKFSFTLKLENKSNVDILFRAGLVFDNATQESNDNSKLLFDLLHKYISENHENWSSWYRDDNSIKYVTFTVEMPIDLANQYQNLSTNMYYTVEVVQANANIDEDRHFNDTIIYPEKELSADIVLDNENKVSLETILDNDEDILAVVPAGVKLNDGTTKAVLKVSKVMPNGNINVDDEVISRTLDIHLDNVVSSNEVPIIITIKNALPINMNMGAIKLYHKENGMKVEMTQKNSALDVNIHNDYYYDSTDGTIILALRSFSEIEFNVDTSNEWDGSVANGFASGSGTVSDPYIVNTVDQLAYFSKMVNEGNDYKGEYVRLDANLAINSWDIPDDAISEYKGDHNAKELGEYNGPAFEQNKKLYKFFTPIGHGSNLPNETLSNDLKPFRGTFDGNNYTISGLFNLWYDDPGEWSKQIGLFGCVEDASIQNLTIADSFIYTYGGMVGLVSSFAGGNTTFENINISFNYATTYNNYLGGVVGCVFDYNGKNAQVVFKNVNVDNSNKLEALWATYDAPIGGIVGGSYANSHISFIDCNVYPELNLYNDCCANYQWFAYRYSGMLIGYVRSSNRTNYLTYNVHCENVCVKFGDWTDQYYCELRELGKGSYNGAHEWKYIKIRKDQVLRDNDGNVIGCSAHNHKENNNGVTYTLNGKEYFSCSDDENNTAVNITFKQLFGGGQGVYGETEHDGVEIIYEGQLFKSKFINSELYLYRVGNIDKAPLNAIFSLKDGVVLNGTDTVNVTIENMTGSATGFCSNESDWTKRYIEFDGRGLVKISIKSRGMITQQIVEVIDGKNATGMVNAEETNVVLLQDVSLGNGNKFIVSNGHTLYGNGFTISTSFAGYGLKSRMADGFVELSNGNLENVKVISAIYPRSYLYNTSTSFGEALEDSDNLNTTIAPGKNYYFYQYNAVKISGKCNISNCYIEGARNNLYITDGVDGSVIYNTTLAYGSLSNIYVGASSGTITLRDVSTIQDVKKTNLPISELNKDDNHKNDDQKTVFGLGILVGNDESESYPILKFEGLFTQHNWIKKGTQVSSKMSNMLINMIFSGNDAYLHTIGSDTYANVGVVYLSKKLANINDTNLKNKDEYLLSDVTLKSGSMTVGTGQTYSFIGEVNSIEIPEYEYNINEIQHRVEETKLIYIGDKYEALEVYDDEEKLLIPTISVEIEAEESVVVSVKDIVAICSGEQYRPVKYIVNGQVVENDYVINCNTSEKYIIECSGTTSGYYDVDGKFIGDEHTFKLIFKLNVIAKSIDPPQFVDTENYSKNTHWVSGWTIATTPLENISLRYFSKTRGCYLTIPLSLFTPSANGKSSNGGTTWTGEYDGCTLTLNAPADIKTGYKGAFYTSNGIMYYTLANSGGYSNTTAGSTRQATVEITVTDSNNKSASFSKSLVATYNDSSTKLSDSWSTITGGKTTKYIVRLDSSGGEIENAAYGPQLKSTIITLNKPTRDGYEFIGWFDQIVGGTRMDNEDKYTTTGENVVLYAHWKSLKNSIVTFDLQGGDSAIPKIEAYGLTKQILPNGTKNGYWLNGWYTAPIGGVKIGNVGEKYTQPEENTTYYAQWSPIYMVNYDANGGMCKEYDKYEGNEITLPIPTINDDNKAFVGWFIDDEEIKSPYIPTKDVTIKAKWGVKVVIVYNTDGGSLVDSQIVGQGVPVLIADAPIKNGYTFIGWMEGLNIYNPGDIYIATSDVAFIAKWAIEYNIALELDGGSGSSLEKNVYNISEENQVIRINSNPTKEGFTFSSWSITKNSNEKDSILDGLELTIPAGAYGDITISAKWTKNSSSCLIPGTIVTMADGTKKLIEDIKSGDMLLTWDLTKGAYSVKPVVFNDFEEAKLCDVIYVSFSDNTQIGIVSEHGFFDLDLCMYVYLDENAEKYIGHRFMKEDGSAVTLVNITIKKELIKCYSPVTSRDLCYYVNGMLSMPGGIQGLFNIFDVDGQTMSYNELKMQEDIETFGLFTLEDFDGLITKEMFEAFNGCYLSIAIGKGNITWEYIYSLAKRYSSLC